MNSALRSFLFGLLLLAGITGQAAVDRPLRQQGLQISLSTSRYEIEAATSNTANASLAASVALTNLSGKSVDFSFPSPAAAAMVFKYRVLDSAGAAVWESDADLATSVVATARSLPRRGTWKRTQQIPLSANGQPLALGRYTLEATLAGTPAVGATTTFTVTAPASTVTTGIRGQVTATTIGYSTSLAMAAGNIITMPSPVTGVPAQVQVTEIRLPNIRYTHPPFSWSGSSDPHGFYQVETPPGTFLVQVTRASIFETVPSVSPATLARTEAVSGGVIVTQAGPWDFAQASVVVRSGRVTEQNFRLFYLSPPESVGDTGISGIVLKEELVTTEALGSQPQIVTSPIAGATIRITPLFYTFVNLQLQPLGWSGRTDENGHFRANLGAGSYRIQAYTMSSGGHSTLIDSTVAVVQAAQFTSVELRQRINPVVTPEARVIYRVNNLALKSTTTDAVILEAQGTVTSGGWSNGQLVPRPSLSSAVLEFDFVATPPSGAATLALEDISATVTIQHPQAVETIRVYGTGNSQEITRAYTNTIDKSPR